MSQPQLDPRLRRIQALLAMVMIRENASVDVGCSALANLLVEALILERQHGRDEDAAAEMRRVAERLVTLANAPLADVDAMATALADSTVQH
jgi:ribosomal protein L17